MGVSVGLVYMLWIDIVLVCDIKVDLFVFVELLVCFFWLLNKIMLVNKCVVVFVNGIEG